MRSLVSTAASAWRKVRQMLVAGIWIAGLAQAGGFDVLASPVRLPAVPCARVGGTVKLPRPGVLPGNWRAEGGRVYLLSQAEPTGFYRISKRGAILLGGLLGLVVLGLAVLIRRRVVQSFARVQEAERRYRELLQHANSIILRLNRRGEIIFINEFGLNFFGYTEAELLGQTAVGTIVPETESTGRNLNLLLDEICQNPAKYLRNLNENRLRDGTLVWIDWTNKAIRNAEGQLIEVLCIGSDVTAQKKAEEVLRQAHDQLEARVRERTSELSQANLALHRESDERLRAVQEIERLNADLQRRAAELAEANDRLQELDRLKSEFLATMSHELRTPLNSIIGFTGILRQGLAGPLNPEQTKQLNIVFNSARHLLSLINDLLDLSRIEAGKIDLDLQSFDFRDTVEEVVESMKPLAQQKHLALFTELPEAKVDLVGDRKRCYQVLLNLAGNAIKFTEKGEIKITVRPSAHHLEVRVSDTGIGIKTENLGLLFEAFRQVDGSAKRIYDGTGLGLHLCRRLLTLMGGRIEVQSEYGRGSRFTFILPRQPAPAQPKAEL